MKNLCDDIDDHYYKPTKIYKAFDNIYVEHHSNGDKDKILSVKECLYMIRQYLSKIINDHDHEWKIQLSMKISFVPSKDPEDSADFKDSNETCFLYTNSDNISILTGYQTHEIIDKLFKSHLKRYQEVLKEKMKGSDYIFESVDLMYYQLHILSLNRGGSNIDSPKWWKNIKSTINPKNNDDKCFQYTITVELNHQKINNHPEKTYNIFFYIKQYKWNEIEFTSNKKDWNNFEKNNKKIALNVLFVLYNTKEIKAAYISKHNSDRKDKVNLLMITDGKKWHYLAVKKLPELLRGITSKNNEDFCCLNFFHSYTTKK